MHQALCYYFTTLLCLSAYSWGENATHSQSLYEVYSHGFYLVGQLHSDQITFGPLPAVQKIHHRDYINGIPLNAKVSDAWQKWDGKVCLHYTFHKNDVQAWYQMETNTQTNPHIQDAGQAGICQ